MANQCKEKRLLKRIVVVFETLAFGPEKTLTGCRWCDLILQIRRQTDFDARHMLIAASRHAATRRLLAQSFSGCHHGALDALWRFPNIPAKRLLHVQVQEVPFRKQLKDESRERKKKGKQIDESALPESRPNIDPALLEKWELTVGLEIHAQLNTEHKLFSGIH